MIGEETGPQARCGAAAEKAIRQRRMRAALAAGDTETYLHERLAHGFASDDIERDRRFVFAPPEPVAPRVVRAPRQRGRRRLKGGHPARRSRTGASRSARAGPSGDSDSDPHLAAPPFEAAS